MRGTGEVAPRTLISAGESKSTQRSTATGVCEIFALICFSPSFSFAITFCFTFFHFLTYPDIYLGHRHLTELFKSCAAPGKWRRELL